MKKSIKDESWKWIFIYYTELLCYYQKNDIEIDEKKVDALMSSIIMMENLNLRTHAKSDSQMIADIQKKIEEELQCY